jgi:hypothetical protein
LVLAEPFGANLLAALLPLVVTLILVLIIQRAIRRVDGEPT